MKEYKPQPIDTFGVELPDELFGLSEEIARNVHEVWALNRMREGWTFGPERDDVRKKHPCLIPYDDLPEAEKDFDRRTSMETIKYILKLGYRISK